MNMGPYNNRQGIRDALIFMKGGDRHPDRSSISYQSAKKVIQHSLIFCVLGLQLKFRISVSNNLLGPLLLYARQITHSSCSSHSQSHSFSSPSRTTLTTASRTM